MTLLALINEKRENEHHKKLLKVRWFTAKFEKIEKMGISENAFYTKIHKN